MTSNFTTKQNSNLKLTIYDSIRNKSLISSPEETVRQTLIKFMISKLNYPPYLMAIEKQLASFTFINKQKQTNRKIPNRRLDVLVFSPNNDYTPLLIIECKAGTLNKKALNQIIGYNSLIGAPYLALVNAEKALTAFYNKSCLSFSFSEGLPNFYDLLNHKKQYFDKPSL